LNWILYIKYGNNVVVHFHYLQHNCFTSETRKENFAKCSTVSHLLAVALYRYSQFLVQPEHSEITNLHSIHVAK